MTLDPKRIKEIFLAVTELPDQAAQVAYLEHTCGGDAGLRERVEALLCSHDPAGSFLDAPAAIVADSNFAATMASFPFGPSDGAANPSPDDEFNDLQFLLPSARPDALGRIGHYDVLQVLGQGGFGIVFRAFDDRLQRVVAIKVMAPQMAATSPARKRFLREARSSAQVRHEHVVQVHNVEEQPLPYLVMEFIPGETLQQRLDRVGPLDVQETLRVGRQIAEGLAAAHAMDLIHRDVKPGNVLLEGGQYKVKITDFGLARAADDASLTQSGMIAGTPMYMAPEQALGGKLDQRADLFSLGSVIYQMVAGRPPFRANTTVAVLKRVAEDTPRDIREIIPETPQWLCDIIAKLHAKNPDERFQSAREVADVLADCETQLKANSRLQDFSRIPREKLKPRSSRRWKLAFVTAAIFFAVMVLVVAEFTGITHILPARATRETIKPAIDPTRAAAAQETFGWVQLFNGKDLTGWKFHPDHFGHWEVKDGILRGSKRQSYLFSERGDYANFHLRAEVKINLGGDSGIHFRAPLELRQGRTPVEFGIPDCYEAELQQNRLYRRATGSISDLGVVLDRSLTEPDEWFTYEVIAENNHFITKINGVEAANCRDPLDRYRIGHLALQVWHPNTLVQFRKVEIKELPPSALPLPATRAH